MLFCYPLHFIHRLPKYKAFGKQKVCCKFVTNICNKYRNRMQISFLQSVCGKVPHVQKSYANQFLENCLQQFCGKLADKQYNEQPQNITT